MHVSHMKNLCSLAATVSNIFLSTSIIKILEFRQI